MICSEGVSYLIEAAFIELELYLVLRGFRLLLPDVFFYTESYLFACTFFCDYCFETAAAVLVLVFLMLRF